MESQTLTDEQLLAKWDHLLQWTEGIFTWTSGHELCWLAEMASRAENIAEIGSYHGKSALTMALANPKARITCIDWPENDAHFARLVDNLRSQKQVEVVRGTSEVLARRSDMFDFCFIDGGHLYEDVKTDIERLLPKMGPGAVISGHDWRINMNDGVNRGVLANFPPERINVYHSIWHVKL